MQLHKHEVGLTAVKICSWQMSPHEMSVSHSLPVCLSVCLVSHSVPLFQTLWTSICVCMCVSNALECVYFAWNVSVLNVICLELSFTLRGWAQEHVKAVQQQCHCSFQVYSLGFIHLSSFLSSESIKDAVGRKIKLAVKKRVKLEIKGDKVENRVLVSRSSPYFYASRESLGWAQSPCDSVIMAGDLFVPPQGFSSFSTGSFHPPVIYHFSPPLSPCRLSHEGRSDGARDRYWITPAPCAGVRCRLLFGS